MPGVKTNERPGVRASLSNFGMSASKARVVLNLIRGEDVNTARDILSGTSREAADVIGKVLGVPVLTGQPIYKTMIASNSTGVNRPRAT